MQEVGGKATKEDHKVSHKPANYHAYLLRCWTDPARGDADQAFRFSVEDPHTGERQSFAGLGALAAFLRTQLGGNVEAIEEVQEQRN